MLRAKANVHVRACYTKESCGVLYVHMEEPRGDDDTNMTRIVGGKAKVKGIS